MRADLSSWETPVRPQNGQKPLVLRLTRQRMSLGAINLRNYARQAVYGTLPAIPSAQEGRTHSEESQDDA
jgi:hypothetical protein